MCVMDDLKHTGQSHVSLSEELGEEAIGVRKLMHLFPCT